jgi:uncharacterized membrane protein YeaQ/YmgE (transglycosylase-associated protein family)
MFSFKPSLALGQYNISRQPFPSDQLEGKANKNNFYREESSRKAGNFSQQKFSGSSQVGSGKGTIMGIIAWIILGGLAGWLAGWAVGTRERPGCLVDVVIGIVGAVIGGLLFSLIGGVGFTGFNLWSLFVAFVGAVVLLLIIRAIRKS